MKNQVLLLNEIRDQLKQALDKLDSFNPSYGTINISNKDLLGVITNTLTRQLNLQNNGLNSLKNDYKEVLNGWHSAIIFPSFVTFWKDGAIAYGFDSLGNWFDSTDKLFYPPMYLEHQIKCPYEKIESMLREHCRKLGLDDDTVLEHDSELENYDHNANYGNNSLTYDHDTDTLWNRNGVIYRKGKFARPSGGLRRTKHVFKSGRKYDGGLHFFDFFASIKPQLGDELELQEGTKLEIIDTPTKVSNHSYCFGVKKIIGHGNI